MSLLPASSIGDESTGFYPETVNQSLRFNEGDTPYLSRTFVTPSSTRKIIIATWIKPSELGDETPIMYSSSSNTQNYFLMGFAADGFISATDNFNLFTVEGNTTRFAFRTERLFRDSTNWMHVCACIDTTQATSTDRVVLFFNGKRYTGGYSSYNTQPSENRDFTVLNSAIEHRIGAYSNANHAYGNLSGYLSEFYFIDGQSIFSDTSATINSTFLADANTLATFCEQKNGVAVPKKYSGTFGNNGCRLTFEASGTGTTSQGTTAQTNIGDDQSGQGHNFSVNGLASTDVVPDSPTNNFCTLNPLDKSGGTFSEGNLRYDTSTWDMATGTFLLPSGKWYYEVRVDESVSAKAFSVGIIEASRQRLSGNSYYWSASGWSTSSQGYLYGVNVNGTTEYKISAGSAVSLTSHPDIVQNSVIGIFIDLESSTTSIKYNVDGGTPFELFTGMQDTDYVIGTSNYQVQLTFNFGQDSTFAGKGDFHSALPSSHTDYLALCSSNLPKLALSPAQDEQANNYFDVGLYQSTGGASDSSGSAPTLNFTDFAFQPDWVIVKGRSYTDWGMTFDSARGPNKNLQAFRDYTENDYGNTLTSFNSDGFTLGADSTAQVNWRQNTYVTHGWKAGGAPTASNSESAGATPTAGSVKIDGSNLGSALAGTIPATEITASTTAGFSVVLYTGTGSAATVAHGLSSAPEFILVMGRSVSNSQMVGITAYNGWTHYIALKNAGYSVSDSTQWNNTAPTSSVFSVGTAANVNQSSATYVAYCMHSVEGFSKIGTYVGNSSSDGTFVYLGFRPAFVLVKLVSTGGEDFIYWDYKRDPDNLVHNKMYWNANNSEITDTTNRMMDFLAQGFKHRTNHVSTNTGGTYLYMAFAEQPFKFSNAR